MRRHGTRSIVILSLLAAGASAADPVDKRYPISTLGELTLHVPGEWQDISVVGDRGGQMPSMIEFMGKDDAGSVQLKLLPIVPPVLRAEMKTDAGLKKICESGARRFIGGSVEKKVNVVPIDGPSAHGFTYTLTDASGDPGEFKCTSGGAIRVGDVVLIMTLMHQPNQPAFKRAIDAITNATVAAPTSRPAAAPLMLSAPSGTWRVVLPDPGCGPAEGEVHMKDAKYAASGAVNFTAFFEPAGQPGSAAATGVRDFYYARMQKNGAPMEKPVLASDAKVATLRYTMFGQPNAHAYVARGGMWVDLHFSWDADNPAAGKAVDAALAKVAVEDVKPAKP